MMNIWLRLVIFTSSPEYVTQVIYHRSYCNNYFIGYIIFSQAKSPSLYLYFDLEIIVLARDQMSWATSKSSIHETWSIGSPVPEYYDFQLKLPYWSGYNVR